ncbi:MAG: nicotinate-nucleotide adenylyltransferase [Deltaproteobacteria bacterium]|nr:nicotinate-nucleotide adenylyltransferase [Deltaproteobacteria bacterium]
MRIGLFGGTFDPIHRGHLQAASEVKTIFKLNPIYIIPAALPPHKTPASVASADDRLAMIHLAIGDIPGVSVSDVELQRRGPSYTIDTIHHFKSTQPQDAQIFLIVGIDAFLEIDTWKSFQALLEQISVIVMARPDDRRQSVQQGWKQLEEYLIFNIATDYRFSGSQNAFLSAGMQPVYVCDVQALGISSTQIRQAVKHKHTIENWVPAPVAEYIHQKGLYT